MFEDSVEKRDPVTIIFYCGLVPFAVAWWIRNSLATGFAMEAYLVTCCVFIVDPFEMRKERVRQRWYWRIMLRAGLIVHPPVLIGLWFLDKTHSVFVGGTGTIFLMALVISVCEIAILGEIVKRFQPEVQ
ncbi:MAG TPA: hypothetical protein VEJ38_01180 [Candidatus Acidoferrales bacterium]|nr:hypothetical protein [Candidatus Acidoferrales bacterium]